MLDVHYLVCSVLNMLPQTNLYLIASLHIWIYSHSKVPQLLNSENIYGKRTSHAFTNTNTPWTRLTGNIKNPFS